MAYDANFSESATFNATFAGNAIDAVSNEVIDIRTAYDGTVYPSAGDAVRSQIEEAMESSGSSVPTNVRQAMLTLFESAAYAETGLTDEIAVVQSWASEVTEISLSASTLTLNGDTPQTLVATTVPTGSAVVWSSSDNTIATVVGGVVTGVSNGTCRITASAGTKSATCAVTVTGFAELVSISAVYTQSGTVYDTDSLDDLKADLVVTATYDDTSTAVITNYVLSGTLAEGTSTITVTYGGKATTFNVTVVADGTFPSGVYYGSNGESKITISNGNHVKYEVITSTTTHATRVNLYNGNMSFGNDSSPSAAIQDQPPKFTIRAGSTVVFSLTNITKTISVNWLTGLIAAINEDWNGESISTGSTPSGSSFSVTVVPTVDHVVGCAWLYIPYISASSNSKYLEFDFTVTVDGATIIGAK